MFSFSTLSRAAFGITAALALSSAAFAQSTILVVDQGRVIRDSSVGKHVAKQIESIGKSMESELKASASPIQSERDRLMSELKSMDAAALKSRPDLQKRAQDLVQKGQKTQVEAPRP